MSQSTYSIRMDTDLKNEFDSICEDFGMSASVAISVFARAVVRERRIPFEIKSETKGVKAFKALRTAAAANGIQDMDLDEINNEIAQASKRIGGRRRCSHSVDPKDDRHHRAGSN